MPYLLSAISFFKFYCCFQLDFKLNRGCNAVTSVRFVFSWLIIKLPIHNIFMSKPVQKNGNFPSRYVGLLTTLFSAKELSNLQNMLPKLFHITMRKACIRTHLNYSENYYHYPYSNSFLLIHPNAWISIKQLIREAWRDTIFKAFELLQLRW